MFQRHRRGRVLRHHLGQLVDLAERHFQDPAHIAQHAARQKRAESDDLRHLVGAIAAADIGDHLVAAGLAEIDVEIRHRHAFGIEKALEQQGKADRIEVGDGQGIGDERARARTAPRPDGNPFRLGPFDEVRDDQEIAGELHPLDDRQFEFEPFRVILFGLAGRGAMLGEAVGKPRHRLRPQFGGLVRALREVWQDRLSGLRAEGAAQRDLDAVARRLGQVLEQLDHFGAGLEAVLARQAAAVVLADHRAFGNAQERVMRLVIRRRGEIRLVGRHQRQFFRIGDIDQPRLDLRFAVEPMPLQLNVKPARIERRQRGEAGLRDLGLAGAQSPVERAVRAAAERDQPLARHGQLRQRDMRRFARLDLEPGLRGQMHQIGVASLVLRQQHDIAARRVERQHLAAIAKSLGVVEINGQLAAGDRLDPLLGAFFGDFQRAEQVVAVGDRQSRLRVGDRQFQKLADRDRALAQREGRVHVQMDEADPGDRLLDHPRLRNPILPRDLTRRNRRRETALPMSAARPPPQEPTRSLSVPVSFQARHFAGVIFM